MTTQTEAQRLADRLDLYATGDDHQRDIDQAAAELRRLSKLEDEWAALSQDSGKAEREIERQQACITALEQANNQKAVQLAHDSVTIESLNDKVAQLMQANAELVELLTGMTDEFVKMYPIYYYAEPWGHDTNAALKTARAAIAKHGGQQ